LKTVQTGLMVKKQLSLKKISWCWFLKLP
jgi:hypothetical protein